MSALKHWLSATRPRTLPAALAPVIVGTALAYSDGADNFAAAGICLGFALLAQIAANFANEYFDYFKGADTEERVGPRRAVASGLISPKAMLIGTNLVCVAAFLLGLCLIPYGGWPLVVIGLASLICAIAYTGGPFPLAYLGLGDVFVFLFFGLVAVGATYYVQAGDTNAEVWVCAAAIGLLTTNILIANNYRDMETDRKANKKTLVVRFGRGFAKYQFVANHVVAFLCPALLFLMGERPEPWTWLLFVPLLWWAMHLCWSLRPERSPKELIAILAGSGRYVAVYAIVLSAWIILGS